MHILHLEDDGPLREILGVAIKAVEPECKLRQFIKSDDAMGYIKENTEAIDLFILDIRVPGSIDGLDVARRVRDLKCPGTIVLTSAYRPPDKTVIAGLECEWFPKPWHIFETTSKVLEIARRKRVAQSSASEDSSPEPPTPSALVPKPSTLPAVLPEPPTPATPSPAPPAAEQPASSPTPPDTPPPTPPVPDSSGPS
jgi:DNA-binding response OmpR family regulator